MNMAGLELEPATPWLADTLPTVLRGPANFLTIQVFCFIIMEKKIITLYNFVETQYVKL